MAALRQSVLWRSGRAIRRVARRGLEAAARLEGLTLPPRLFVPQAFVADGVVTLPPAAARHVQVLRLQPGDALVALQRQRRRRLAGARSSASAGATVERPRRRAAARSSASSPCAVTLALGVPANDRMDALVEKAGELGAAAIQPLVCERSVVRLSGERAEAKRAHWQAVAAAASEQCGRARVAAVAAGRALPPGCESLGARRRRSAALVLSLAPSALDPSAAARRCDARPGARSTATAARRRRPERAGRRSRAGGGSAALARGFVPVGLGPRVLRADTAPLALLAWLGLASHARGAPR